MFGKMTFRSRFPQTATTVSAQKLTNPGGVFLRLTEEDGGRSSFLVMEELLPEYLEEGGKTGQRTLAMAAQGSPMPKSV